MTEAIIIIGGGGHGKVIADIVQERGEKIRGFLDDNTALIGQLAFKLPILGIIDKWLDFASESFVIGVGDNVIRQQIAAKMEQSGFPKWGTYIHPKAIVSASAKIGHGSVVMAGAVINPDALIGNHVIINTGATVDHDCVIGDFAHIAPGVNLAGGVSVGVGSLMGIGSCVIPYTSIGEWVTVGAGATVVKDIADSLVVVGTPAQPLNKQRILND